ncbi:hypothetical protein PIB30_064553 [Stylosanthes scabra]|uniref:Uncharacterized protein n=1 Tax=Stylosanthes scabra TaxID=79078 RepID=A0ABU6YL67_9FABA|nr:hypothetical protein [Stylosanthes scabra]
MVLLLMVKEHLMAKVHHGGIALKLIESCQRPGGHIEILRCTGDDCVALNGGISFVNITDVFCGPGHGIGTHAPASLHMAAVPVSALCSGFGEDGGSDVQERRAANTRSSTC